MTKGLDQHPNGTDEGDPTMQLFKCPFCGSRDQTEFTHVREADDMPALTDGQDAWYHYVYDIQNPRGKHAEWWHHQFGCRQMLLITRDTMTHEVTSVTAARQLAGTT